MTPSFLRRSIALPLTALCTATAGALLLAACAPRTRGAQLLAPPKDACVLAREDAARDPRLDVERVPTPIKMDPPPIPRAVPRTALRRDGSSVIKVEVLVDTLGRPHMNTFKVIESSNAFFVNSTKAAIAKWKFESALRSGCKVTRYYRFSASSAPRARR